MPTCYSFVNERWLDHSKSVAEWLLRDKGLVDVARRVSTIFKNEGLDIDDDLLRDAVVISGALHDIGKTLDKYQRGVIEDLIYFHYHDQAGAAVIMYYLITDPFFNGRLLLLTSNSPASIARERFIENNIDALLTIVLNTVLNHHFRHKPILDLSWRLVRQFEITPECLGDINTLLDWLAGVVSNDTSRLLVQRLRNNLNGKVEINHDIKRRLEFLHSRVNHRIVRDVYYNTLYAFLDIAVASVFIADAGSRIGTPTILTNQS
jgi:hypothetical protein